MGKGALGQLAAYWPEDTARHAHVPLKRVSEIALNATASASGDRPALVTAAGTLTYAEVSDRVRRLAAALRARVPKGSRVAIALEDPAELVAALFACFETEMLALPSAAPIAEETLRLFQTDLVIGAGVLESKPTVTISELFSGETSEKPDKPDYKKPLIAFAKPDRSGELLHNHKTLAAQAIAVGSFYMIDGDTRVLLAQAPTDWLSLALLLGTWQKAGAVVAGWRDDTPTPERVDYIVSTWNHALERYLDRPPRIPRLRIGAGAIVGVESGIPLAKRRRLSRRLGTPVLTLLGRSDLGPVLGSHPTWFLDDAVGIPLPNVDTRPINPATGEPLNIGWDAVESAELGVKSALAPAGGDLVAEGWLRSRLSAEIDPTGLYFLR
jgi:acyl-CoA synthetase (AMP-forming)/AMP-acid ligase II